MDGRDAPLSTAEHPPNNKMDQFSQPSHQRDDSGIRNADRKCLVVLGFMMAIYQYMSPLNRIGEQQQIRRLSFDIFERFL